MSEKVQKNESSLKDHVRIKKKMLPPFARLNLSKSSWINDRLPEMLWAVLLISNLKRDDALNIFRSVISFVEKNKDCYDVTLTGISKYPIEKRIEFIKLISKKDDAKKCLKPLIIFPKIPSYEDWKNVLDNSISNKDWIVLNKAIAETMFHQSEKATDCRWVKYTSFIVGGKLKFFKDDEIKETLKGVCNYPYYGDLRFIRPFIRSGEISLDSLDSFNDYHWSKTFWEECYRKTDCVPEEMVNKKLINEKNELIKKEQEVKKYYLDESIKIKNALLSHFYKNTNCSNIDIRHDVAFGLAFYGLSIFHEIIMFDTSLTLLGRMGLRSLVENYITFKYLLNKELEEKGIWEDFYGYGIGSIKLTYLKNKDLKEKNCVNASISDLDMVVNEDAWIEFVPITLGHWNSKDLRKISEEVKLKDLYDKYYDYSSGFVHSNWGSIRLSVFEKCAVPLHRYHRVPILQTVPILSSVTDDLVFLLNAILECLSISYPKFNLRISKFSERQKDKK